MKRLLILAVLAFVGTVGLAAPSYAGAFGLFYCPKYCASYCQAACPYNAFSGPNCCGWCPMPPMGPPCATQMPHPAPPPPLGPIHHGGASFGTGGLRGGHGSICGGKLFGKKSCGMLMGDFHGGYPLGEVYGPIGVPSVMPTPGGIVPAPVPAVNVPVKPMPTGPASNPTGNRNMAQYWTANMGVQPMPNTFAQPVSYQGYYPGYNYPMVHMMSGYPYGYGQYPNYPMPMLTPPLWMNQGQNQGW